MTIKKITAEQVEEAMTQFCPFYYSDVEKALETIQKAEGTEYVNTSALYEIVADFVDGTDVKLEEIDPVACVYDNYHQVACIDIENATGKDISNDDPYSGVNVSGNYMSTTFDGTSEEFMALKELIKSIPEEDRSHAVEWLLTECDR